MNQYYDATWMRGLFRVTSGRRREKDTHLLYSLQALNHHQTVNQLLQESIQSETTQNLPLSVIICVDVEACTQIFLYPKERPEHQKSAELDFMVRF